MSKKLGNYKWRICEKCGKKYVVTDTNKKCPHCYPKQLTKQNES